jgi:hypothetical protein
MEMKEMVTSGKCKSYCTSTDVLGSKVKAKINNFTFRTKRWGKSHFVDTFSGNFDLDKEHLTYRFNFIQTILCSRRSYFSFG